MKKILWDLINTGYVVSFIDDVIVGIEGKEGHDKVVKRLADNNLYMKTEKCKWKVRKVGFLELVIRLEGIKMEKEKMKRVLE